MLKWLDFGVKKAAFLGLERVGKGITGARLFPFIKRIQIQGNQKYTMIYTEYLTKKLESIESPKDGLTSGDHSWKNQGLILV